jgi:hypothetical protein
VNSAGSGYVQVAGSGSDRIKERERGNGAPKSHVLKSGLLWLTINLALIIQCLSRNNIFIFLILRSP